MKQNKDIKGILIKNKEHISQHADDTLLALNGSPKSPLNHYKPYVFIPAFLVLR